MTMRKKILYVRSGPYKLSFDSYNLQEVGLGAAFCEQGYDFDIVYYSDKDYDQVVSNNGGTLRILWRKGIKILRTGIYFKVLKKDFLSQYDIVFTSEYSQLMSVLIAKRHSNTYLYNGPYYNLFKLPFIQVFYDKLYGKKINKLMRKVFCKTEMAKEFIAPKGITNTVVTGVGLDDSKFINETEINDTTKALLNTMSGSRCMLYVGQIIQRKNVDFIIRSFISLKEMGKYEDVKLVLVGKGDASYTKYCKSLIPEYMLEDVVWCEHIKNAQMKFIYQNVDAFLLPSVQEIFGMVLLEAMYFNCPVISSYSAGASTLIRENENGIIIKTFDEEQWKISMAKVLDDKQFATKLGNNAGMTIREEFMWNKIVEKMLKYVKVDNDGN